MVDKFIQNLKGKDIGVSIHYATPVPLMTYYTKKYGFVSKDFPNACHYGNQVVSLPVHPLFSKSDIKYVCDTIIKYLGVGRG